MAQKQGWGFVGAMIQGSFVLLALCWFVHVRLTNEPRQPEGPGTGPFLRGLMHKANLPQKQVELVIQELGPSIARELQQGNRVTLPDLGRFEVETIPGHWQQDPQTGNKQFIPPSQTVKFTPSDLLRQTVNKN